MELHGDVSLIFVFLFRFFHLIAVASLHSIRKQQNNAAILLLCRRRTVAFVLVQFHKIIKLNFYMWIAWTERRRSNATIHPIVANSNHNGAKNLMNRIGARSTTISVRSSHSALTATDKQMRDKWTRARHDMRAMMRWQSFNRQWHRSSASVNARSHAAPHTRIPDSIWRWKIWKNKCELFGVTRQLQSLIYYEPICARFESARLQL